MGTQPQFNNRGVTLIELLVGLVIAGIVIASTYRVFILQTRAYAVQDQVVEVQQNIRIVMETMVKDLRMSGFEYDNTTSLVQISNATSLVQVTGSSFTVEYEYYRTGAPIVSERHTVTYTLNGSNLERQLAVNGVLLPNEILLENVDALDLTCGVDGRILHYEEQDGVVDNWLSCGNIGTSEDKVIAVRVSLTARPEQVNPDLQMVSPRTLISTVALRNPAWIKM